MSFAFGAGPAMLLLVAEEGESAPLLALFERNGWRLCADCCCELMDAVADAVDAGDRARPMSDSPDSADSSRAIRGVSEILRVSPPAVTLVSMLSTPSAPAAGGRERTPAPADASCPALDELEPADEPERMGASGWLPCIWT